MNFIGEIKTIKIRECTSSDPEELIKCDRYRWMTEIGPGVCQWKMIDGRCGHPVNRAELKKLEGLEEQIATNYQKNEYCKSINCGTLKNNKCVAGRDDNCPYTAKEFHGWLKGNNFKIIKDK